MTVSSHDLSPRQLQYIVAVAETLGFHKAAERCHVSQPTLSAQVKQLEDVLGVRIFERDRRRVLLTAAGAVVVEHARRVLLEIDDMLAAAKQLTAPRSGTFRIGIIRWVNVNDLSVGRSVPEVLRVLDALQTDELCPCNWKKGDPTLEAA